MERLNPQTRQDPRLTLLVLLDALRGDYLTEEDAPFFGQIRDQGLTAPLRPTFGFEPDGAFLAGLYPDEGDGGAHYWRAPETSPFRWIGPLAPVLKFCPNGLMEQAVRRGLSWVTRKTTAYAFDTVAMIPFGLLPQFSPVRPTPEVKGAADLFALCTARGIPWVSHRHPWFKTDAAAGVRRLQQLIRPPVRFAFWYVSDLDKAGHRYGPLSPECRAAVRRVDEAARTLVSHLRGLYAHLDLVVMGDHGMVQVEGTVDVQQALASAGLGPGPELLYFLDSTMARFWFREGTVEERVMAVLRNLPGGAVLEQEDRDRYHLNYRHNRFGDLIYLADLGRLISPNFYQGREMVRGMHGYRSEEPQQQSLVLIHGPAIQKAQTMTEPVDMRRVFPTVLSLLGVEPPAAGRVESLIQASPARGLRAGTLG
jgi:predicted AlkP superfamily pyrophosphatase or phosphodiesterase